MTDIIIIGKGPAGLSAALYAGRSGLTAAVIGKDGGALEKAEKIENYFGTAGVLSGRELLENGYAQAKKFGVEIIADEVFDIAWDSGFTITAKNGAYHSKAVILTTGASRKTMKIKNIEKLEGKGVSYCAVCDAFFYRGKDVAVLGNGEYALHETNVLLPVVKSVVLLTNGTRLTAEMPEKVKIINTVIESLEGEQVLQGARFADGTGIDFSGLFIALGSAGATDLARKIGAEVNSSGIVTDENMATGVPGLFAAGDCTGGLMQVSVAVGEGAKAATNAVKYIKGTL